MFTFEAAMLTGNISEKREHYLKEKYNLSPTMLSNLAKLDPTPTGSYAEWIWKNYDNLMVHSTENIKDALAFFEKNKVRSLFKRLYSPMIQQYDVAQLMELVNDPRLASTLTPKTIERLQEVSTDGDLTAYEVVDPQTLSELSEDTSLCTKARDRAKGYLQHGDVLVILRDLQLVYLAFIPFTHLPMDPEIKNRADIEQFTEKGTGGGLFFYIPDQQLRELMDRVLQKPKYRDTHSQFVWS